MDGLKKLTEQDYEELTSMRISVFDRSNGGNLVPSRYELLSEWIGGIGQEYDVSEFVRFLNCHKRVYELRTKEVSIFPELS